MLVIDNGDAIRGIAEVASKLDFIVNGYVGTAATQLADGQLASSEGDLYASGANATVVTSITIVNTDSAARTFTLYLKPSGGTSRAITPVSLDLGIGFSCYTDGQRIVVMDLNGSVVTTLALSDASPNTIEPDDSASSGTGALGSREDHEHAIVGAAPGTNITPEQANAEGSATSFARSDHMHYIPSGAPSELASVQAAAEGSGAAFARTDHAHQIQESMADNHIVTVNSADVANADYAKFTSTGGLEGKTASELMGDLPAATDSAAGKVELALAAEVNTGTSTALAVTPDALAGSIHGEKIIYVKVMAYDTALTTGDSKAIVTIPDSFNGMNLVDADIAVYTVSSSGTPTVQIHNLTDAVDMLSTLITIDVSEFSSYTAVAPPVINGTYDDVATGDRIRIDVDIAGTGTKGLDVIMTFQTP